MTPARVPIDQSTIDRLQRHGRLVLRAFGPGMCPAVPEGACVDVRPVSQRDVRPGDLLAYHYGGGVYLRRLLRRTGRLLVVKDDASLCAEPAVTWAQVLGRAVAYVGPDARLVSLDNPWQRRLGRLRARASYLIGAVLQARRLAHRAGEWHRYIRLAGD